MYKSITNRWNKISYNFLGNPYFNFKGKKYMLDNFVRCHNNPWVLDTYPEYIHGYDPTEYYNPLFIEISKDGEAVKVYEYTERSN